MAFYVDSPNWQWRGEKWCHLVADSVDELHAVGRRLGLKPEWFQFPKTPYPHYDLTERRRRAAVQMGALEVSSRFIVEKCIAIRPDDWWEQRLRFHRPVDYQLWALTGYAIECLEAELELIRGAIGEFMTSAYRR